MIVDPTIWKLKVSRLSYWYHQHVWKVRWQLAAAVASYSLLALGTIVTSEPMAWLLPLTCAYGCWLLISMLWAAVSVWYSASFRYLAWWLARSMGWLGQWLARGWRKAALLLGAIILGMWLRSYLMNAPLTLGDFLTVDLSLKVIAVATLLWLLHWAYQARKRIFIPEFTNFTGDEQLKASLEGLPPRVLSHLANFTKVYRDIDEVGLTLRK